MIRFSRKIYICVYAFHIISLYTLPMPVQQSDSLPPLARPTEDDEWERNFEENKRSDSCINNVKLNLNCTKDYSKPKTNRSHSIDHLTYTRGSNQRYPRGSLDNISNNPWGGQYIESNSLRRSRSLALSKDRLFTSLEYPPRSDRRSQLIPRAKLIDKPSIRGRSKVPSVENTQIYAKTRNRRASSSINADFSAQQQQNYDKLPARNRKSKKEENAYDTIKNIEECENLQGRKSGSDTSSNKRSSTGGSKEFFEDLQELSLPRYYPEAKYDTDNTDNFSITDNISSISLDNLSKIIKFQSFEDLKFDKSEYESISYDENIVLSTNKNLYDNSDSKPRSIRNPTPYQENYEINPQTPQLRSLTLEDAKSIEQTDTNLDEIKLKNENIIKYDIENNSLTETNPVYESKDSITAENTSETTKLKEDLSTQENKPEAIYERPIKTLIEVTGKEGESEDTSEQYKTIVAVDFGAHDPPISQENLRNYSNKNSKTHCHSYLREILETQKGSKKPLQNFIARKFYNLSRKHSREPTNLTENQFHSLPDITISKNLRKCEKIDKKLRKCEKTNPPSRPKDLSKENRFIVNIGNHFSGQSKKSVPVDFEVKISKLPKKLRKQNSVHNDEQLLEAVKQLKETLHGSQLSLDENQNYCQVIDKNKKKMDLLPYEEEYKEKLGTMRRYWKKIADNDPNRKGNEDTKCKIVDFKTKVDEVKKKFEPNEEVVEEKPQSKVQLAKQLFEPRPVKDQLEKKSSIIKETCNYFENNSHMFDNPRPFESLCPNSVEIIDGRNGESLENTTVNIINNNSNETTNTKNPKVTKPLVKSNSTCNQPAFDHVRYKVIKSDLFQKKIFANCEQDSQIDELIQYLQDYSFQELLIDNNIVIIEPIRSKVTHEASPYVKSMRNITPKLMNKRSTSESCDSKSLNRHFFYHPIRVNKEVNDAELPNPDTVRQAREFFEGTFKKARSVQELNKECTSVLDPDKDRCSATDSTSNPSNMSDYGSQENLYDSIDNEIYCEYVSEDILKKIRDCGTTITYYGGRVVNHKTGQPVLTKVIMEEIKNNQERCLECKSCRRNSTDKNAEHNSDGNYVGVKFRIVKSNSCSSRMELLEKQEKQDLSKKQERLKSQNSIVEETDREEFKEKVDENRRTDNNEINESIKRQATIESDTEPKIIGEEMKNKENKMTQWKEIKNDNTYSQLKYSENGSKQIFDYYNYDKIRGKTKIEEMEFEPYEVA